eukprot:GGOE01002186.1.p1 GENE.GGOE01002186.1~~GGOE01002186.1.p1  ORF type:complete len:237 (-),score=26.64 GGOE01002186.1:732-1442(-)
MEEYLEEQRRRFTFAAADAVPSVAPAEAAAPSGFPRQPTFSPFSTLSSSTSSDISDFIFELRQGYGYLKRVREPGKLSREELREILVLLEQDPTEELLSELFHEVDVERKGSVDFEQFLLTLQSKIGDAPKALSNSQTASQEHTWHPHRASTPTVTMSAAARSTKHPPVGQVGQVASATPGWPPRPASTASAISERWCDANASTGSGSGSGGKMASSRKGKSQVLWWGFQDLADTL